MRNNQTPCNVINTDTAGLAKGVCGKQRAVHSTMMPPSKPAPGLQLVMQLVQCSGKMHTQATAAALPDPLEEQYS